MNKEVQDKIAALEAGLLDMFSTEKYSLDFKHLGDGVYQFTKDGTPCIFDEESEFRLRVFLNSFNILTEVHERGKEGEPDREGA